MNLVTDPILLRLIQELVISGILIPTTLGIVITFLAFIELRLEGGILHKRRQRILVVGNRPILGAGIENLLRRETHLDVVGVTPQNEAELLNFIKNFRPTAIILDEAVYTGYALRLLVHLEHSQEMSLVIVNEKNNQAQLYFKRRSLLSRASDIIDIVNH